MRGGAVWHCTGNPNTHVCFNVKCTLIQTKNGKKFNNACQIVTERISLEGLGDGLIRVFLRLPPRFRVQRSPTQHLHFCLLCVSLVNKLS